MDDVISRAEALALTGDEEEPANVDASWDRATDAGRLVEFIEPPANLVAALADELPALGDEDFRELADAVSAEAERRAGFSAR